MNRALLNGAAAVALIAAVGRRIRRRPRAARGRADGDVGLGGCRAHRHADLLPGPRRQAALFADAPEDAGRQKLSSRTRRGGRQLRFRDSGGAVTDGRGIRATDQILSESDGPSGHVTDAEEGFDGDGLHPRLRRRGHRRRVRQAVARQDSANGREIRTGRAAAHQVADPGTRHRAGGRAPHLGRDAAVRGLRRERRERHHRTARSQGATAHERVQSRAFQCGC